MTQTLVKPALPVLRTRGQFAGLCNQLGIVRAFEIGTDRGVFAEEFLKAWNGQILVCVDNWEPYPAMPYDRTADLLMAVTLLAPFRARVKIARGDSLELAKALGPSYMPGFIYIDGDHHYDAIAKDLDAWWPALAAGGIFAGHDYMAEMPGVMKAADEFAADHGLELHVTELLDEYRSWWMVKP